MFQQCNGYVKYSYICWFMLAELSLYFKVNSSHYEDVLYRDVHRSGRVKSFVNYGRSGREL